MGMWLEEGIGEGRLVKEASSSLSSGGIKRFGSSFAKKKEETMSAISRGRKRRYQPQQIAIVTPVFSQAPPQNVQKPQPQQPRQQAPQQNQQRKHPPFDPIPMTYTKLLPLLVQKNLVQLRDPPPLANPPFWYKADARYAFHKNAPGHTVENCDPVMNEVQKLVRSNMITFKDVNPIVQVNSLPNRETVNAIQTQSSYEYIHDVRESTRSLVQMHIVFCGLNCFPPHNYSACSICSNSIHGYGTVIEDLQKLLDRGIISISRKKRNEEAHFVNMVHRCPRRICFVNSRGCFQVRGEIQKMLDERTLHITYERDYDNINMVIAEFPVPEVMEMSYDSQNMAVIPLTIQMSKPFPYNSTTTIPWRYGATIITGEEEVRSGPETTIVNIADTSRMTRSSRLFAPIPHKPRNNLSVQIPPQKDVPRKEPIITEPIFETKGNDVEEFLNLIKKRDYMVVDQLLQTQSKISLLALLVHSKAHWIALMKVLKQAYIEQDATLEQFDNVVSNITVNNVLSFSKEELPLEELEHNHALHINMKCGEDTLTNVLVDTGSSLNVTPRSTLERLSYQGATIRLNGIIVKAFDGSKCTIIDISPAYNCLLGRPWIYSAGAVTSTLHQMLKFAVKDKLITVYGE
ncbi:uncharacterized protein LOC131662666 [Vicia villosa]|uniref:uncharacterized protein LOC131662666 n=1 Tax=Vicia villosa TaxID=3911 RepID=UPI00273B59EC|nr:uncharacterized protein LOC131662666 [Vicia villosa]